MMVAAFLLAAAAADPISGTWEGTSLCQVKPSPCHDERVIYRIKPTAPQNYTIDAYKLVAGEEQFMGSIKVAYDTPSHSLNGSIAGQRGTATVHFSLKRRHLSGSMTLDGQLYRLIEVDKR